MEVGLPAPEVLAASLVIVWPPVAEEAAAAAMPAGMLVAILMVFGLINTFCAPDPVVMPAAVRCTRLGFSVGLDEEPLLLLELAATAVAMIGLEVPSGKREEVNITF